MPQDPTAEEMRTFLNTEFAITKDWHDDPGFDFDVEEAIYWFAYSWHGGGGSNLYSALSTSEYRPGPLRNGPEEDSLSAMMLESLEAEYTNG